MSRQRGMALITVLLVVAVVTVVSAGIIARQQLSIRSSANQLHVRQAWHYALGGETLAKEVAGLTAKAVTLASINPAYEPRVVARKDIVWMGRILWVSQ